MQGRSAPPDHELAWEAHGEGRPAVFLHGLTVDRRLMIEACEPSFRARPGWRRIYVDLPGHGGSRGRPEWASADALVAALGTLISELVSEPPALVGYSYGGYLAQGLAVQLQAIAGLFLACPVVEPDFGRRTTPPRRVVARDEGLSFAEDPREREAFEEIAVRQSSPVLERFRRIVHPANLAVDRAFLAALRARYVLSQPYVGPLGQLETPVAIVCGRHDHWTGFEDAARLCRMLPDAGLSVLPGCGHLLPLEAPEAFGRALGEWLTRL